MRTTSFHSNIVLLMTDQQRADSLGCAGNAILQTPHLDQMAAQGTRFTRAYTQAVVCMPSRATMMTGRYPLSHRVRTNGVSLPFGEKTLPAVLASAGYHTEAIGKLHLSAAGREVRPGWHRPESWSTWETNNAMETWHGPYYGFDRVELAMGHSKPGGHYRAWLQRVKPDVLSLFGPEHALEPLSGAPRSWKSAVPVDYHVSTWIGNTAEQRIRVLAQGGRPFFLWISFPDPHFPFAPPAPYAYQYAIDQMPRSSYVPGELEDKPPHFRDFRYGQGVPYALDQVTDDQWREMTAHTYGMVSLVDDCIGRVFEALRETGLDKETLVLFVSDHGELLGDHGLLWKGPFHYESLMRVPFMMRGPGIKPGQIVTDPVGLVDVMPTVLDWVGLPVPPGVQGQSLVSILSGKPVDLRPWALTTLDEWRHEVGNFRGLRLRTLVLEHWKITMYGRPDYPGELYDLQRDPGELVNLWDVAEYREERKALQQELLRVLIETVDSLPEREGFA